MVFAQADKRNFIIRRVRQKIWGSLFWS